MYYITYHDIPQKIIDQGLLPKKYVLVSRLHPRADIYAPFTRYIVKEGRVHQVRKDGGTVEVAIRNMDKILVGSKKKELRQAQAIARRAHELLDLYGTPDRFAAITPDEFMKARTKTYRMLRRTGLNPTTVFRKNKKRMSEHLIKGSFGRDGENRRNWLISTMALQASYREAIEHQRGIAETIGKFVRMREALIFEREFSMNIFSDVTTRLSGMQHHDLFRKPGKPLPKDSMIVLGILRTLQFQLEQPHVKPYRTAGLEAATLLSEIDQLVRDGKRGEIARRKLIPKVLQLLKTTLTDHAEIYPVLHEKGDT